MKKSISRSIIALGILSGMALSSSVMANTQTVEASVDLKDAVNASVSWVPVTGLSANIGANKPIGQFNIQLNGANYVSLKQVNTTGDVWGLSLDGTGNYTDSDSFLAVKVELNDKVYAVDARGNIIFGASDIGDAKSISVVLETFNSNDSRKPGHYSASYEFTSMAV